MRAQDAFSVSRIAVDVTGSSATVAREEALAQGQRLAYRALIEKLVPPGYWSAVPQPPQGTISDLIEGFSIAEERASAVRYIASLNFQFDAADVRRLWRSANVPFAETLSKPVLVLPLFNTGQSTLLWESENVWHKAWQSYPTDRGLVPLLAPLGDLSDISLVSVEEARAPDLPALLALAGNYGAERVVIAHADLLSDPLSGLITIDLEAQEYDQRGLTYNNRTRVIQESGESLEKLMDRAVLALSAPIQAAWQNANLITPGLARTIDVTVPLVGMADWIKVRDRLNGVAVLDGWELVALSRGSAQLKMAYSSGEDQLIRALAQRNLILSQNTPEAWTLAPSEGLSLDGAAVPQ